MSNFGSTAIKLAKNPLSIIALFIVLIYSIACLTFGFSQKLPEFAIICFTFFLIGYPLIVLIVFYRLVTAHHTKLYAPEDFPNPGDFLECTHGDNKTTMKLSDTPSTPKIQTLPEPQKTDVPKADIPKTEISQGEKL